MPMVQTITEKTGLPLGTVASLVVAVVTVSAVIIDTRARANQNAADTTKLEAVHRAEAAEVRAELKELETELRAKSTELTLRTQRNEDAYASILKGMGRLEDKVDRIIGVRPARGGR